jgi:D-alanyl-lipoteichoic acid acyltransferase DltB (MBOAT superfamily)
MTFNSVQFLIFFPVVTVLYFALPNKFRWMLLLVASYYFYMSWNPSLVFLILFTTVVSYGAALLIEKSESK